MEKIQRFSKTLQIIFKFFLITLPIVSILLWFYFPIPNPLGLNTRFFPIVYDVVNPVDFKTKLLGFAVSLIPLCIELYCIHCLVKLFNLFENGKIFTAQNVQYIRNIGMAILFGELVRPFYQALVTLIIHFHNPRGHEAFSISFGTDDISYLLTGIIILLISWVMAEACKLHEEHTYTI